MTVKRHQSAQKMTYNNDSKYSKLSYVEVFFWKSALKLVKVILAFVQIGTQSLAHVGGLSFVHRR